MYTKDLRLLFTVLFFEHSFPDNNFLVYLEICSNKSGLNANKISVSVIRNKTEIVVRFFSSYSQ